jgi:hypothetical protein
MATGDSDFENLCNGSGLGEEGCYIATCVYGSYDCPEVWTLRRWRDNYLKQSALGRAFVKVYYAISPQLVEMFGNVAWIRAGVRKLLDRLIKQLHGKGYDDTPCNDK